MEFADDVRDKAAGVVERVGEKGGEVLDAAKSRVEGLAEEGKEAGAGKLSAVANAILAAADDLEDSSPEIARHVRSAADAIEGISGAMHQRSSGQLFHDLSDFARRQPTAFFGVTAMAGFALVRFAKSSTEQSSERPRRQHRSRPTQNTGPGSTRPDEGTAPAPMTTAQATLRGAAAQQHGKGAAGPIPTGLVPSHDPAPVDPTASRIGEDHEAPKSKDQSRALS
ncbi:hypothetical protein [Elioraea sp.]|uniref:hypothetical protein n=1 Tax=Elioraea sp. TaxID=2185103 RepID=UPI0025C493C9|nr:hypothetical protein [Elioraea sp.]